MDIIAQANIKLYNPQPKTKQENKLYFQHERAMKVAKESHICPGCGRKLYGDIVLIDHGYKYGVECEICR